MMRCFLLVVTAAGFFEALVIFLRDAKEDTYHTYEAWDSMGHFLLHQCENVKKWLSSHQKILKKYSYGMMIWADSNSQHEVGDPSCRARRRRVV